MFYFFEFGSFQNLIIDCFFYQYHYFLIQLRNKIKLKICKRWKANRKGKKQQNFMAYGRYKNFFENKCVWFAAPFKKKMKKNKKVKASSASYVDTVVLTEKCG